MTTLDELERSVERLNRAVERLRHRVDLKSDNPYVVSAWSADDVLTRIVPHDDLVEMADAFRLLLSERAELLATVERMRRALEQAELDAVYTERERAFWRSLKPKGGKNSADCKTDYERELYSLWQYEVRQRNVWRGIASAMGYEPKAHDKVKPTQAWLIERVAMFRARAALTTGEAAGSPIGQNDKPGLAFSGEGVKAAPMTAQELAEHAQFAFENDLPDDFTPYDCAMAWRRVGEHLAAVLAERADG